MSDSKEQSSLHSILAGDYKTITKGNDVPESGVVLVTQKEIERVDAADLKHRPFAGDRGSEITALRDYSTFLLDGKKRLIRRYFSDNTHVDYAPGPRGIDPPNHTPYFDSDVSIDQFAWAIWSIPDSLALTYLKQRQIESLTGSLHSAVDEGVDSKIIQQMSEHVVVYGLMGRRNRFHLPGKDESEKVPIQGRVINLKTHIDPFEVVRDISKRSGIEMDYSFLSD